MKHETHQFSVEVYDSLSALKEADAHLLNEAKKATALAYAPYSNFKVSAVAQLVNGKTLNGYNQENASFPVGICAERVLLSAAASVYPGVAIETIAISYHNVNGTSDKPISPCGICRQSLLEYEQRMKHPIRLILGGQEGKIYVINTASVLLPLAFKNLD